MTARTAAFVLVGAAGFAVQVGALAALTRLGWPVTTATAAAVELAVLHNFCWHVGWTWRDRRDGGTWRRLVRFHVSNGLVSLAANVALTWGFVRFVHLPTLAANTLAVAAASAANYFAADRWVFARAVPLAVLIASLAIAAPAGASPSRQTVDDWKSYVRSMEAGPMPASASCAPGDLPSGSVAGVSGGAIHRWFGCTIVHGQSVDAVVDRLVEAGTPPPHDDVLNARVLERGPQSLRVYLRLIRRSVVSVTYDTEHDVTFTRQGASRATSRSVATRIEQTDGGDYGFLWQLRSYWTYTQVGQDVHVTLVSLSLSRDVPVWLRPVASPLIDRVARESMASTLDALQRFFEAGARPTTSPGPRYAPRGAARETPASSRAARTHAARDVAPGRSPWMQMVSTGSVMIVPSRHSTSPRTASATACLAASAASSTNAAECCRDARWPVAT